MGRGMKAGAAAALLVATLGLGFIGNGAQAKNALCPKTCLTAGTVIGGSLLGAASAQSTRDYNYVWTAVDLTDQTPELQTIAIHLYATGYVSGGAFHGTGDVMLTGENQYYGTNDVHVRVDDNGKTVRMSGGGFNLAAVSPFGAGAASWKTTFDQNWEYCDC